jgi:hypothetical protein
MTVLSEDSRSGIPDILQIMQEAVVYKLRSKTYVKWLRSRNTFLRIQAHFHYLCDILRLNWKYIVWCKQMTFWEELIACFPFIWHVSHRKRRVQQFFYCCVRIRCRGNVFTQPLPSNGKGIHIEIHRLMGDIYEVRRWDGSRCPDVPGFIKLGSVIQKLVGGTHRQHGDLIILHLFFFK